MAMSRRAMECHTRQIMASTGQDITMLPRSRHSGIYCRLKMLCLLIAHGIFLRQEASQSRRAIMKRVPDLQRPTWRMLDQVPVRYPPHARAVSRV